jgi:hypothetical protein
MRDSFSFARGSSSGLAEKEGTESTCGKSAALVEFWNFFLWLRCDNETSLTDVSLHFLVRDMKVILFFGKHMLAGLTDGMCTYSLTHTHTHTHEFGSRYSIGIDSTFLACLQGDASAYFVHFLPWNRNLLNEIDVNNS